jgi:trk system potassium uptake protein TrkA
VRVIIAGAGHAGLSVAAHLRRSGHDVTVIERDDATARRAFEQFGLVSLAGDATSAILLREAEVGRADVVVAMLRRDADNLAVALLARAAGAGRVMVRMRDTEYRSVYLTAGVHRILSETDVIIGALATAIEHEAVRHSMVLGAGESIAFELVLPPDAAVAGHTVSDVAVQPGFPVSCVFAAMSAEGGPVEAPRGSSVLEGGMALLLVVRRDDLARTIDFFMRRARS